MSTEHDSLLEGDLELDREAGEPTGSEIAVVGMACRYPGADSVDALWRNLRDGVDSLHELTPEELGAAGIDPEAVRGGKWVPVSRQISDDDRFDADFFGMASWEAEVMEPQYRVFLECAWQAFEDAGYDPKTAQGLTGVFAGSRSSLYLFNIATRPDLIAKIGEMAISLVNDKDYLATRVSYLFDLKGPSVSVQTACSTSLVAVHMGCQSLIAGEADTVLAGGVALRYPSTGYPDVAGSVQSSDGRVRTFDARADGTMFGSGVGAVVLKRLEDALADGDTVRAVIRGSGISNDGAHKVGFAAPSLEGQSVAIRSALLVADVDPESIDYVEAHGTGTPMGDPIEVQALTKVYRESTRRTGYCALGSIKSNIGHASAASGVAGLIKTVLALENEQIPPSLHYEQPNPQIDFASSPFFVNDSLRPWPRGERLRRAGVSSFGMGGTNVHVVVEEAPVLPATSASRPHQLLVLSARSADALARQGEALGRHLEAHPELAASDGAASAGLADVAYTLQVGRRAHAHRRALVCADRAEALRALAEPAGGRGAVGAPGGRRPSVAFLFSGQGSQYPGMMRGLYGSEPVFAALFDRCAEIAEPLLGYDLRSVVHPEDGVGEQGEPGTEAAARLAQTACAQPALFAVEYALAGLWRSWGVEPRALLGHSIGEYVAACVAGVLSLEDALAVVVARGRLMQELPAGSMLAVPLAEDELAGRLEAQLSIAAVNAPGRSVVSGPTAAVDALRERLEGEGIVCRPLHTSHAFHSAMMAPILAPFAERLARVTLRPPEIPFVSNVTGTWITDAEATDPGYWARHLRGAVRFADGVRELLADDETVLLEVGPGNTLTTLARRHPERRPEQEVVASVRHPKEDVADQAFLLQALGRLWCAGVPIDWSKLHGGESRRRVPLPGYPFERQRYWVEPDQRGFLAAAGQGAKMVERDLSDWFYLPSWAPSLSAAPAADLEEAPRTWWVFGGGAPLAGRILETLRGLGQRVVEVAPGERFERPDGGAEAGTFRVRPAAREDFDALVDAALADGGPPDVVLHLWNVSGDGAVRADGSVGNPDEVGRVEAAEGLAFWSQLFLAQAIGRHALERPLRWLTVSDRMQRVGGERALDPLKATLLGPVKVIPIEYPNVTASSLDLEPDGGRGLAAAVDRVLAEATGGASDLVVAVRDGERYVQEWREVHLGEVPADEVPLRDRGVYLITGGLGGIGVALAEFLAREHSARLVLVGRTPLPERDTWDAWLDGRLGRDEQGDRGDRMRAKIRCIRALEALGAEVLTPSADVTDPDQMAAAIGEALERFGTIDGVIHAAGLPGGGMIQLKTVDAAAAVLAPKIRGTLVLEQALAAAGCRPELLVVFSSTISCLGGLGQVDYCAADSFLDAWAHQHKVAGARIDGDGEGPGAGEGGPTLVRSVGWGAWAQVGMAVETGLIAASNRPSFSLIHPEAGTEAFRRLLSRRLSGAHVVVSARDLHELIETVRSIDREELMHRAGLGAEPGVAHARPDLPTPYVAPRDDAERRLAAIWSSSLGLDEVGVEDNFFDLGGDSVMAIQLIARANEAGFELAPDHLFEHQTVAALARLAGGGAEDEPAPEERWEEWLRQQGTGLWRDAAGAWLGGPAQELDEVRLVPEEEAAAALAARGEKELVRAKLDAVRGRALLDEALPELRATFEEVVLAALVRSVLDRWHGERLRVEMISDGRSGIPEAAAFAGSSVALPFACPVVVDLVGLADPEDLFKTASAELVRRVKEQVRGLPGRGAAFAALALGADAGLRQRLDALPRPQVSLEAGAVADEAARSGEGVAGARGESALDVLARVEDGAVILDLRFAEGVLGSEDVEAVAATMVELLGRIATTGAEEASAEAISPTDFPEAGLDEADLAKVLAKLGG